MATYTGVSKSILNYEGWNKLKNTCNLVTTHKRFRPYGTPVFLHIIGKTKVKMAAENGAQIETWSYIHKNRSEKSLLGNKDAVRHCQVGFERSSPSS